MLLARASAIADVARGSPTYPAPQVPMKSASAVRLLTAIALATAVAMPAQAQLVTTGLTPPSNTVTQFGAHNTAVGNGYTRARLHEAVRRAF